MVEEDVVRVTQVSTSTSPNPDTSKQHRSRISLTTNPATSEKRVSKKPRMTNVQVQTDFTTEYGTLADHLFKEKVMSLFVLYIYGQQTSVMSIDSVFFVFQEKEKRLAAEAAAKFDYFARVKETISVAPVEKLAKVGQYNDDEDYFEVISGVCSCHRVTTNKQNTHYLPT